jgi:hypothetical protein
MKSETLQVCGRQGVLPVFRYGVAAALIVSAAAAANSQGLLDRAAELGSCSPLAAAAPRGVQWWECKPGAASTYPDLSKDSCRQGDLRGEVRYWLCPAGLAMTGLTEDGATS